MKYCNYILKKINNQEYGYLSISLDYSGLDEYICDLENDLRKRKFKGKVIFDLLTNSGLKDRFFQADFDGNKILLASIKNIPTPDLKITEISSKYYLSNFNLIQRAYISKQSKFLIRKELEKIVNKSIITDSNLKTSQCF